jgi:hypothetical protein
MFNDSNPYVAYCTAACIQDFNSSLAGSLIVPNKTYFLRFDDQGQLAETDVPKGDQGPAFEKLQADCLHYLKTGEHPSWEIEGDQRFLEAVARSALSDVEISVFGRYNEISADNLSGLGHLLDFKKGSTAIEFFLVSPGESVTSLLGYLSVSIRGIRHVRYMSTIHGEQCFKQIVGRIEKSLGEISICGESTPEITRDKSSEAYLVGRFYNSELPRGRLASLVSSIKNSDDNAYSLLRREALLLLHGLTLDEVRAALSLSAYTILDAPSFRDEWASAVIRSAEAKIDGNLDRSRRYPTNIPTAHSFLGRLIKGAAIVMDKLPDSNVSARDQADIDSIFELIRRNGS